MRTRDKLRVDVKVRCSGCGVGYVAGNATIEPGTRVERKCIHCGATIRAVVTEQLIGKAIEKAEGSKQFAADVKAGRIVPGRIAPEAVPVALRGRDRRIGLTDGRADRPSPPRENGKSKLVTGARALYHYAVYVRHPWGTDKIVVSVRKQKIQLARDAAWDRVSAKRKTGNLKIMDAVPMKWTENGYVEVRRTRIKSGDWKTPRRAKSRASVRKHAAGPYVPKYMRDPKNN